MKQYITLIFLFKLSLLALTINTLEMHPNMKSYIAAPEETLKIRAKHCSKLPLDKGAYTLKAQKEQHIQCDGQDIEIIIKDAKSQKGYVNHYKIGSYPKPMRGLKSYKAPQYFLTIKNAKDKLPLSQHFNAKSFLCKQQSKYPKYLVLQSPLINLLELMLEELDRRGKKVKNFVIMSGYRTPAYNRAIGSSKYSRHMYGDAADIYVDDNHDGIFDDLDGDGKTTNKDTRYLADLADTIQKKYKLPGGVGIYKRTSRHPRFVHVDTRGYIARWGH